MLFANSLIFNLTVKKNSSIHELSYFHARVRSHSKNLHAYYLPLVKVYIVETFIFP